MKPRVFTKKRLAGLLVAALALTAVGTALAVNSGPKKATVSPCDNTNYTGPFKGKASRFNPGNVQPITLTSAWGPGAGELGGTDKGWVAILNQTVAYPSGASADLTITPVNVPKQPTPTPVRLCELGFDYLIGSHCSGGAPRFDVETANGVYAVGCADGTEVSGAADGWQRVVFDDSDFVTLSGTDWITAGGLGTAGADLTFLQLLDDERGDVGNPLIRLASPFVDIDQIDVNTYRIGTG